MGDLINSAWSRNFTPAVAGSGASMALHETWVDNSVVGGGYSYTAVAFLHDDSENKTRINSGTAGNGLDRARDTVHLVISVVVNRKLTARAGHDLLVGGEPITMI